MITYTHFLTNYQHGFRVGRFCATQLLETIDRLSNNIDKGEQLYIYLNFQKAFDSLLHRRLISRVEAYGFHSQIVNCVKGFLLLTGSDILSGVPQDSFLGPVLFLILTTCLL